ncbi:MAG TPA: WecB/TagA/CpsF family glycosyltransferase [Candidatus Sulfotelmatobacter sp.]|nr:WecB/TagA/CpsF family glycosyltransferase [Candidatus Sulfotelmatobacter sp.]
MPTEVDLQTKPLQQGSDSESAGTGTYKVLGVRVNAVQIPDVIAQVEGWIAERGPSRFVAVTGMHGITEARRDSRFRDILDAAGLVVSDGMPLVWLGRWHGNNNMSRRVYGPELTEAFCAATRNKYRHFFYGGAPGVADDLARSLQERHGIRIAGTYCPPFRPLTEEEDREVMNLIQAAEADIIWVGLSTPKQETWMYEHRNKVNAPAMFGIGAAFDLNTGRLKQAPSWMREHGLEWLFRLLAEPKRLWRRYLVFGSVFAWNVGLELLGLRVFD